MARERLHIPVSSHPIDSINLKDSATGLYEQIQGMVAKHGSTRVGPRSLSQPPNATPGSTVNEYETLLMQHDLREVLANPIKYMMEKAHNALADPRAIPNRALEYAKYDLVRALNQMYEHFGWKESFAERVTSRFLAFPADRFLRMKRSLSLLVVDREERGRGELVQGVYQSPILVQWEKPTGSTRAVDVTLTRFV